MYSIDAYFKQYQDIEKQLKAINKLFKPLPYSSGERAAIVISKFVELSGVELPEDVTWYLTTEELPEKLTESIKTLWDSFDSFDAIDPVAHIYNFFGFNDSKGSGIVLTPPYMANLLSYEVGVCDGDTVLELCSGAGTLLLAALRNGAHKVIGVERDKTLYALSVISFALHGLADKAEIIHARDALSDSLIERLKAYKANRSVCNPPYEVEDKGMRFVERELDVLVPGGTGIVITQSSAGSGAGVQSFKDILAKHTIDFVLSVNDNLFVPKSSVSTEVYKFTTGTAHDENHEVKFVKMADDTDGIKRTKRSVNIKDLEQARNVYDRDIEDSGFDSDGYEVQTKAIDPTQGDNISVTQNWHFDTVPTEEDFLAGAAKFMQFELDMILQGKGALIGFPDELLDEVDAEIEEQQKNK